MYDYYLGGRDNFAADREAAEQALEVAPGLRVGAREIRRFVHRAVRMLVENGIRQFIDLGCGLPTQGNVHEVAQAIAHDARVAYVDNDPVVIAHARALLETNPLTTVVEGDLRDPDQILTDPTLVQLIDLKRPVAVLLVAVLHVIPDDKVAAQVVASLRDAVASGSYLAITHAVSDREPETTARLAALYQSRTHVQGPHRPNLRTKAEVEPYFDGLELVEPGCVYIADWRPDGSELEPGAESVWSVAGVARKN
jgi:O-methyltransferase involved in polyketide biosynthesis